MLQAEVAAAQAQGSATGQIVTFTDPAPAEEPVGGAVLLDALVALINRFVVVAKEASHAVALWILLAEHATSRDLAQIARPLLSPGRLGSSQQGTAPRSDTPREVDQPTGARSIEGDRS